jgi:S-adenosylmethionine-diacylglycerol 3-amino-3-carboxypropyl transferase
LSIFSKNLYTYGLLGNFIGLTHWLGRLYGRDPRKMLAATSPAQQRAIFETHIAPILDQRFVRWLTSQPASLFGLCGRD